MSGAPAGPASDLEAIRAVFARRLYVMDTKQWDAYGPCHTNTGPTNTGRTKTGRTDA